LKSGNTIKRSKFLLLKDNDRSSGDKDDSGYHSVELYLLIKMATLKVLRMMTGNSSRDMKSTCQRLCK